MQLHLAKQLPQTQNHYRIMQITGRAGRVICYPESYSDICFHEQFKARKRHLTVVPGNAKEATPNVSPLWKDDLQATLA